MLSAHGIAFSLLGQWSSQCTFTVYMYWAARAIHHCTRNHGIPILTSDPTHTVYPTYTTEKWSKQRHAETQQGGLSGGSTAWMARSPTQHAGDTRVAVVEGDEATSPHFEYYQGHRKQGRKHLRCALLKPVPMYRHYTVYTTIAHVPWLDETQRFERSSNYNNRTTLCIFKTLRLFSSWGDIMRQASVYSETAQTRMYMNSLNWSRFQRVRTFFTDVVTIKLSSRECSCVRQNSPSIIIYKWLQPTMAMTKWMSHRNRNAVSPRHRWATERGTFHLNM